MFYHTKNICNKRLVWLCFFVSIFLPASLSGQSIYANKLLKDIAGQLSGSYGIEVNRADNLPIKGISASRPLTIHQSQHGVIDHIGIKLFDRKITEKQHPHIFYFVERYLLELLLADSDASVQDKLRLERVKLSSDLPLSNALRKDLRTLTDAFSGDLSFYLNNTNNRYTLSCMNGQRTILSIEFPARHELITGYTKLEAENTIYMELLAHKPTIPIPTATTDLYEKSLGIYVENDNYYMMENIVSTIYYEKNAETYLPVFSQSLPVESICNLFNSAIDYGAAAEITQSLYGNRSNTYEVPLARLTSYLRSQKCILYTAIQRMEKEKIHGALMAVNTELGYQHVFTFTLERNIISQIKNQRIKMKMFSFVPIHNISSIMENNKQNHETK